MPHQDLSGLDFENFLGINENPPMRYESGQEVMVKGGRGQTVRRVVYRDAGARVYITSEDVYRELVAGTSRLWAVGVPRSAVSLITNRKP